MCSSERAPSARSEAIDHAPVRGMRPSSTNQYPRSIDGVLGVLSPGWQRVRVDCENRDFVCSRLNPVPRIRAAFVG